MKLIKHLFLMCLLCLSLTLYPSESHALTLADVPNPRANYGGWVTDMAEILSSETETQLNSMITELEAKNGAEIAVVTVPETQPFETPKAFATELFNYWGIGKASRDNGVLFLVSLGDRRVEIETGYSVELQLSNSKVKEIIDNVITPHFKEADFDAGTLAGTKIIIQKLGGKTSQPSFDGGLAFFIFTLCIVIGIIIREIVMAIKPRSQYSERLDGGSYGEGVSRGYYGGGGSTGGGGSFGGGGSGGGGAGGSF